MCSRQDNQRLAAFLLQVAVFGAAVLAISPSADADAGTALLDSVARTPDFISQRESSSNADLDRNGDAKNIEPGKTLTLGELDGPGVITHFWCTVSMDDVFYSRLLVLRIYWDELEKPSVEVPLGDFFGIGHGAWVSYTSMPVSVTSNGRARTCYWRMPFRKKARITITNESDTVVCDSFYYYLDWQKKDSLPEDAAYFHAQYRQSTPAEPGDYTLLETTGQGQYVGTVYSVHQMENGWFGEGDDRFYIDEETFPSLRGTGSEDYFNDAWGFRTLSTPFYGVPLFDGYFAGDRVSAYRWHLNDPVAFKKSLKVTIEHKGSIYTDQMIEMGGFIERQDWINSVAFWYQQPPAGSTQPWPSVKERMPPYNVIAANTLDVRATPSQLLLKEKDAVMYMPAQGDGALELDFSVPEQGAYTLQAVMVYAIMAGVYQPLMDGKAFGGPIDFCVDGMDRLPVFLDRHDLTAGKHTLRFEGRGASPKMRAAAKPFFGLGIANLILLRLEDMKGFHEAMQKTLAEQSGARR